MKFIYTDMDPYGRISLEHQSCFLLIFYNIKLYPPAYSTSQILYSVAIVNVIHNYICLPSYFHHLVFVLCSLAKSTNTKLRHLSEFQVGWLSQKKIDFSPVLEKGSTTLILSSFCRKDLGWFNSNLSMGY